MVKKIDHKKMGRSQLGWLDSHFHFSFAGYYNPQNIHFGALRVINDDIVQPRTGFDLHPHKDMEIISYVVDGELSHADSMGHEETLQRGEVQYMSAGKGVYHSEHNHGKIPTRFLQVWILPDREGHTPQYGDYRFDWNKRINNWMEIASGERDMAPIHINQDVNVYATYLEAGQELSFEVKEGRQAYLVQIEGESVINELTLEERDALESVEESLHIHANKDSHLFVVEMKKF